MSQSALSEIERNIMQLSTDEQLLLISRVAEKLRRKFEPNSEFENQLTKMANDADIQKELKEIEADFQQTVFDDKTKELRLERKRPACNERESAKTKV